MPAGLTLVLAALLVIDGGDKVVIVILTILGLSTYATACSALAARAARGRIRAAWATMAAALGCVAAGDVIWLYYELVLHRAPVPSPADFFYLSFTVLAVAAMALIPIKPTRQSRLRSLLDTTVIALCLFLLSWILVLNRVFDSYREGRVAFGLALLYPLVDLVALTIAVGVLARSERRQRGVMWLLTIAIALMTIGHSAFAYLLANGSYGVGNLFHIIWAGALVAFAAAALLSRHTPPPVQRAMPVPSQSSLWLPYLPLLLAGTVGPTLVMSGLERIIVPLVVVAVCLRQMVAAWENRQLLSAAAADQALQDPLTGLANRTLFHDRLAHAMMLRLRDERSVSVVSLDLDDFKLVNDTLGHPVADSLLVHVGQRIAGCARPGDTVSRLAGDEFALLLEGPFDDSHQVAQRVVEAFNDPFVVDGQQLLMRPSVGMAIATPDEPELTPDTLVRRANIAMFAAKRSRSFRVHTFTADMLLADPDLVELSGNGTGRPAGDRAGQVRLLGELRHAIDRGALDLVYQPKVELRTEHIVGVEALMRWPHAEMGTLRPDAFIELVRRHGLMRPVTDLVLEKALGDTARWKASGVEIPVAVNLFAPFLRDTHLPDALCRALARHGLPPRLLTVEITEDLVLSEVGLVTKVLRRLRAQGIRVAIDDFGSGYSALSYLRDLQIDEVKLDRHFIASVTTDRRAAAVVGAVIDLTHDLGITVVAEGVEDAETASWLREHNCDIGQGYHFGRPVDAAAISRLIGAKSRLST